MPNGKHIVSTEPCDGWIAQRPTFLASSHHELCLNDSNEAITKNCMPTDAELLHAMTLGSAEAFAAFYDRHASVVYGVLLKMLPQTTDADDVLQETFLQVWRQASRFDAARSTPQGWVVMMARSRALDYLRRKNPAPTSAETPDRPVYPEEFLRLEQDETATRVRHALNQLPAEQRMAIDLAFFGGLTYEQVAQQQQVPLGTAKTRIRLGMKRLRHLLGDAEGESA